MTSLLTPWGELFLGATYNKQFTRSDPSYLGQVLPDGSGLDPAFGTAGQWSHQFAPQQMEGLVAGVRIGNAMVFVGHTGTYARLATSGAFLTRVRMR